MICKYETKTFVKLVMCDDCKCEMLESDHDTFSDTPYIYKCPKCGKIECTAELYPESSEELVGEPIEISSDKRDTSKFIPITNISHEILIDTN